MEANNWNNNEQGGFYTHCILEHYLSYLVKSKVSILEKFQEVIEMDIKASIAFEDGIAAITCFEIKSSLSDPKKAKQQLSIQLFVIEYVLKILFPKIVCIKYGNLFVLKSNLKKSKVLNENGICFSFIPL